MSADGPASPPPARWARLARRIVGSRYFFLAVLVHLGLFGLLGGILVIRSVPKKGVFAPADGPLVRRTVEAPAPHIAPAKPAEIDVKPAKPTAPPETPPIAPKDTGGMPSAPPLPRPPGILGPGDFPHMGALGDGPPRPPRWDPLPFHAKGVTNFTITSKGPVAQFSCYVVRYAGGDWDCNFGQSDGSRWYGNCIYNLMLQVSRWTKGRVNANLLPVPLTLSDDEWLEKVCPPFVFMTGHKDFRLSEAEVENLRKYLLLGGALWVDNALPGRRSRFDIALRRELKRVLPDREFVALGDRHALFLSHFQLDGPPTGMNGYREPVEAILIQGKVAVLYTLNAYSDLWETGLDEKDQVELKVEWSPKLQRHFARTGPHWPGGAGEGGFFRGVSRDAVVRAYQLGINAVIHLLTRFEDLRRGAR
jgi:hypothetical protein